MTDQEKAMKRAKHPSKSPWRTYKPGWLKSNPWAPKREARK